MCCTIHSCVFIEDRCQHCLWWNTGTPYLLHGPLLHRWSMPLIVLLLQCNMRVKFICTIHVFMYMYVSVQIHNPHWMDLLLTHLLWQCGLPWTSWQRESASWQCSHPLQVQLEKCSAGECQCKKHNRTVLQLVACCRPELLLGNGVAANTSFLLHAVYIVVLYSLSLFIDDCKDYAFSLAC